VNAPLGMIFFFAGISGLVVYLLNQTKERNPIQLKSIIGGICLGLLNYISTYTLLKTLSDKILTDSVIFPIINIGVVIVASVVAMVFFKEHLSKKNFVGIALAVLSIFILAIS
jgi:drug/metabolite transporter (DMT)-like permease